MRAQTSQSRMTGSKRLSDHLADGYGRSHLSSSDLRAGKRARSSVSYVDDSSGSDEIGPVPPRSSHSGQGIGAHLLVSANELIEGGPCGRCKSRLAKTWTRGLAFSGGTFCDVCVLDDGRQRLQSADTPCAHCNRKISIGFSYQRDIGQLCFHCCFLLKPSLRSQHLLEDLPKLGDAPGDSLNPGKVVILTSSLSQSTNRLLGQLEGLKELDVRVVDEWNHQVTHTVLAGDGPIARRTVKYCLSVLNGCWCVNPRWVEACVNFKRIVPPLLFEMEGDSYATGGPRKARSVRSSGRTPALFAGLNMYLHVPGNFTGPPSVSNIRAFIRAGGGVVRDTPRMEKRSRETNIVLFLADAKPGEAAKVKKATGTTPMLWTWIMDSISHFEVLDFDKYHVPM